MNSCRVQFDEEPGREEDATECRVSIMTIHKSKGFPVVFMPGCVTGEFPSRMSTDTEEERRLFFVAMTRAKDRLYVSSPSFQESGASMFTREFTSLTRIIVD